MHHFLLDTQAFRVVKGIPLSEGFLPLAAELRSAWVPAYRSLRASSSSFGIVRNSTYTVVQ